MQMSKKVKEMIRMAIEDFTTSKRKSSKITIEKSRKKARTEAWTAGGFIMEVKNRAKKL